MKNRQDINYEFVYNAFHDLEQKEPLLSLTQEQLDEKGLDVEEIEQSIMSREMYEGYYWIRSKIPSNVEKQSGSSVNDNFSSLEYKEKIRTENEQIDLSWERKEKQYEKEFFILFCGYLSEEMSRENITIKISENSNLICYKKNRRVATFKFDKNYKRTKLEKELLVYYNGPLNPLKLNKLFNNFISEYKLETFEGKKNILNCKKDQINSKQKKYYNKE